MVQSELYFRVNKKFFTSSLAKLTMYQCWSLKRVALDQITNIQWAAPGAVQCYRTAVCVAAAISKPYVLHRNVQWNCVRCHEQIWLLTCPVFTFLLSCKHPFAQCCCSAWFWVTTLCKEQLLANLPLESSDTLAFGAPVGFKWPNAILFYLCCCTPAPFSLALSPCNTSQPLSLSARSDFSRFLIRMSSI